MWPEGVKGGEGAGANPLIHMHQDVRGPGSEQEWKVSVAIASAGGHQQTLRAPAQCDWAVETAPPDDVNGSHFHTVLPAHQTRFSGLYRLAHVKSLDRHNPKRERYGYYHHFPDREMEEREVNNLPKVAQLARGKAGMQTSQLRCEG